MRDPARVQAAIDILDTLKQTETPADRGLKGWARANRYAGSKDRRAIEAMVYAAIRDAHRAAWQMGGDDGRALMVASLAGQGADLEALFDGSTHSPAPLSDEERAALARSDDVPVHARLNVPEFLLAELEERFGAELEAGLAALNDRAPLDLRVNSLKSDPVAVRAALEKDGLSPQPINGLEAGLRLAEGNVSSHRAYLDGWIEVQDAGSQWASLLTDVKPGMQVIDYCAGAGGKALAMAAMLDNRGQVYAHDVDPQRLSKLRPRANRAGAHCIQTAEKDDALAPADCVVIDAPCSGSGAWRRGPETRWRLTEARLAELTGLQADIVEAAAAHVKTGGTLVYVTCSILPAENERQIERFLAAHPDFSLISATIEGQELGQGLLAGTVQLLPHRDGTDGFFVARLQKAAAGNG